MVAKNDITGDSIQTKGTTQSYRDNYDLIFKRKSNDYQDILSTEECVLSAVDVLTKEILADIARDEGC